MRFTCRECPDSAFVLRFTWFEALPGDAMHLQGVSGFNIYIHFGPPCTTMRPRIVRGYPGVTMSAASDNLSRSYPLETSRKQWKCDTNERFTKTNRKYHKNHLICSFRNGVRFHFDSAPRFDRLDHMALDTFLALLSQTMHPRIVCGYPGVTIQQFKTSCPGGMHCSAGRHARH